MAEQSQMPTAGDQDEMDRPAKRVKLTGRAFYESIGSPKVIVAPMVDRSEYAWRKLTRSFLPSQSNPVLAYTPMFHSRLFVEQASTRDQFFQPTRAGLKHALPGASETPWLDGNPSTDRPLFVQFCANDPDILLKAAKFVEPYCDAVDLNLGCPQGIARKGHYGAFLQEDWDLIYRLINNLHKNLSIPVTAKFRILETKEKTLAYAKMILSAGASIITVHGRRREQKSQLTGIADWSMIRYLRDNLPPDTVLFSNGNILNHGDLESCLKVTGADGVMSAEGNLSDPTIFAPPPPEGEFEREYWRGRDGRGGYRIDAVTRRYFDIIYRDILEQEPPARPPLFIASDLANHQTARASEFGDESEIASEPPRKKQKQDKSQKYASPNLRFMQGHLFQLFRPFVATYTHIRDSLSKSHAGDMDAFERTLGLLEKQVKEALIEEAQLNQENEESNGDKSDAVENMASTGAGEELTPTQQAFKETVAEYKRPWFVCQPYIRPLPEELIKSGHLKLSKKNMARFTEMEEKETNELSSTTSTTNLTLKASGSDGKVDVSTKEELPKEAVVCG